MRFEPLPGSASEAEEISRLWKQRSERVTDRNEAVVHLSGSAASERAFKRQASGKRIVHLATHGFFLDGDCSSPVRWSRGVGGLSSPEPGRFEAALDENPLLYSGLAFAGANQRESVGPEEEDGILTAQELASVDLSGVELAVLSACDTGAGKIESGEGVLGLGRALHIAGVRTTIMSLWPADDLAAREVMTAFYERYLFRGDPVASALRDATLAVLKRRRDEHRNAHPFFWAGWVVVGSPAVGS